MVRTTASAAAPVEANKAMEDAAGLAAVVPGVTITCRHCRRASPASRRFCGGCGQSLWEACPQCRAENAADERFCGTCGADMLGGLSAQCRQLQARLDEAAGLARRMQFDAALACLRNVAAVSDPRFDKWAQQARVAMDEVERERTERQMAADEALVRAQEHFAAHAYGAAANELEVIPAPLRSADAATLLERAAAARQELSALADEIRAALAEKRTGGLLLKIERLLTLKPDHVQAMQLAEQLRDSFVRQAKRSLAAHRYQECFDLLRQIPTFAHNADVETLLETAGELLALFDAASNAALADRPTLGLAERLVKLAPADPEAAALRAGLLERAATKPADPRAAAPDFRPPPRRSTVGPLIEWWAYCTQTPAADEQAAAAWRRYPGQFHVAVGLALQGLGEAAVPLDLAPAEKGGLAKMFPTLARRATAVAWGLDLSDFALKAVKLVKDPREGTIKLAAAEHFVLAAKESGLEAGTVRQEAIDRALHDFVARAGDLQGAKVVANMPGQRVLGRFFELPPLAANRVADAIAFEAKHQLPVALDELCWASHVQPPIAARSADRQPRRVMVCAARQAHVRDRRAMFQRVGIAIDHLQSECLALHNALAHELRGQTPPPGRSAVCLLDVGAHGSHVVVSSPAGVWFRTLGQGAADFSRAIVKELNVTFVQAEQIVREPARARRFARVREAWQPVFAQFAGELERSLANYGKLYPDYPVERICGLGGGFQVHGLLRHLRGDADEHGRDAPRAS
jgi:Tfp pilus assembly PilM family ATPase